MKKILSLLAAALLITSTLAGCVVTPSRYSYYGQHNSSAHYAHHHRSYNSRWSHH